MRPPRSLIAVLGLTAFLAFAGAAEAKSSVRAVGFQAKVVSISKKTKLVKARVLTAGGSGLSKYKGKTLTFNVRKAKLSVPDTNEDGKANTLQDIRRNDILGLIGTVAAGPLPKVVPVSSLTDVTALLPTSTNLPSNPTLPTLPGGIPLPTGVTG